MTDKTLKDNFAELSAQMRRAAEIMESERALSNLSELDPLLQDILDGIAAFEWNGKKRFTITLDWRKSQ